MRTFLVVGIALQFVVSAALAQPTSPPAASQSDLLSMDQKVKVGAIITEKTAPLTNSQFSPIVGDVVPPQIQIQGLPADAKKLAPQLDGYGCVVFEELIAIVDQNTHKVAFVIPRWRQQ
jgi:hypothetical protein